MMEKLFLIMLSLSTLACVSGYNPRYYFNEIQVVNLSGAKIADVKVDLVGSPKTLACEEVAHFAMCADRFGQRLYPQQRIELSWNHGDGSR